MTFTLIAARDRDGAIGTGFGGLPWKLPAESAHFRTVSAGRLMLVGRKTHGEMAGFFTGPPPLVLTRSPDPVPLPGRIVASLDDAVRLAATDGVDDLLVIGGARVFARTLPLASRVILSEVDLHSGGAVKFPPFPAPGWSLASSEVHPGFTVNTWLRHPPAAS